MKVVIATEGGKKIGFGHLTRCSALYDALEERGIHTEMLISGDPSVRKALAGRRHRIFDWIRQEPEFIKELKGINAVIVDSYLAPQKQYERISRAVACPIYIDDTMRIHYPKGIVVNGTIGAENFEYPKDADVLYLLGVRYIPLRKPFWKVSGRRIRRQIKKVLVTFGGADPLNLTPAVVRMLQERYPQWKKKVVVGYGFKNNAVPAVISNMEIIHAPSAEQMRGLMFDCDVAITAGGQTLYELAQAGLPAVAVRVAENQRLNVLGYRRAGSILAVSEKNKADIPERIDAALRSLTFLKRKTMCSAGRRAVDGKGALRIVDALRAFGSNPPFLKLREADKADCREVWQWRNHQKIRRWSLTKKEIRYTDHRKWFITKLKDKDTKIYIGQDFFGNKIGSVRLEALDVPAQARINVFLNPKQFGRGWGNVLIRQGTDVFLRTQPKVRQINAEIITDNSASVKAFEKAGYRFSCTAKKDAMTIKNYLFTR